MGGRVHAAVRRDLDALRRATREAATRAAGPARRVLDPLEGELARRRRATRAGPAPTPADLLHQHMAAMALGIAAAARRGTAQTITTALSSLRDVSHAVGIDVIVPADVASSIAINADVRRAAALARIRERIQADAVRAVRLLRGVPTREQVAATLVDAARANMWRVDRVVRTESSFAFNQARMQAITEMHARDRRIFMRWTERVDDFTGRPLDNKVAADSLAMHGQIARPGEMFNAPDGAGSWAAPPNRPNDRAVLLPWMRDSGIPAWSYQGGLRVEF